LYKQPVRLLSILLVLVFLASCNAEVTVVVATATAIHLTPTETLTASTPTPAPAVTDVIPEISHSMRPADTAPEPLKLVYDVTSSGSAAPYGDSFRANLFERPFLEDMTYVPDLDIASFQVSEDADWYYVSIQLQGPDPNNPVEIHYGVEIDTNADGFGDFLIWAHPPYLTEWDIIPVQVFSDTDHDTGGISSARSDATFEGNGYETLLFDGSSATSTDPDLAWMRILAGPGATVEFAFKKSLTGPLFLLGVIADAGLKDVSMFDYNDRFRERRAGSPIRDDINYPLGQVFAVDNTCWEEIGLRNLQYVPKLCPATPGPTATNRPRPTELPAIIPPTSYP
jgi:hypothetical protein